MAVERLILAELSQGQSEAQIAEAIGIPVDTLQGILNGRQPDDKGTWEKLTAYFKMSQDELRFGELIPPPIESPFLPPHPSHEVTSSRRVPLLSWSQLLEEEKPDRSEEMVETDVGGDHVFAVNVPDDSMEPLFQADKVIFVEPGTGWSADQYVLVRRADRAQIVLRQIKVLGIQTILHALNPKHADVPFTEHDTILGKVVRVRVDL